MTMLSSLLVLALLGGPSTTNEPAGSWPMTLDEAIRISLENAEIVRVCPTAASTPKSAADQPPGLNAGSPAREPRGAALVIARLNEDASIWGFKAAVAAHVRSVEQQYWALSMLQKNVEARERAVKRGEQILEKERADSRAEHGRFADVAEAEQQLENFKLNLVSTASDLITTERQLRNILGLPMGDGPRIVAVTAPNYSRVEPDWKASLAMMEAAEPTVVPLRAVLENVEAKAAMIDGDPTMSVEVKQAVHALAGKQRNALARARQEATHAVNRFVLEVDAQYRGYETAKRLRDAARKRLDAQEAFYKEGRITLDRLLDAITQDASATSQEAEYLSTYNTSIAALEEAQGTILARDGITILEKAPAKAMARAARKDGGVVPAQFVPDQAPPRGQAARYHLKARFGDRPVLDIELEVRPSRDDR